jgi:three-Cys-motif partner protein
MAIVFARDRIRARDNGAWAQLKLDFLDRFCAVALKATESKRAGRVFLDLFAGPGMNVHASGGHREFEGSTLRALRACSPDGTCAFTRVIAVNAVGEDHRALEERVERVIASGASRLDRDQVELIHGDSNVLLPAIMDSIDRWAYVFAFADIEAPRQWPWSSVVELRRHGHRSIDLYALFPLDMALMRLVSYKEANTEAARRKYAHILTRFFGTDEWAAIGDRRITRAHSPQMRRELEDLYLRHLRSLWEFSGAVVEVRRRGDHHLYKMLFASNHDAGKRIAAWAKGATRRTETGGQELLDLFG